MEPKYKDCVFTNPQPLDPVEECNSDNVCDSSVVISYQVDWDNIYSIHNWVEKLDLWCCPGWKLGMLGSVVFIGWVLTLPWIPRLSDMYSRKKFFIFGMVVDWLMFVAMFLTRSINWMIVITFVFGLMTTFRVNIGFVYMMELMPKSKQTFYATFYNIVDGSNLLTGTIYFWFISKDWIYFTMIGFVLQTFNVIAVWFLPESPRLMIELKRFDEAEVAL